MTRQKGSLTDALNSYDFDFAVGIAYQFPVHWRDDQKSQFRSLPDAQKRQHCIAGEHSFTHLNEQQFSVWWIPEDIFEKART